jgi:hypothetical protein
MKTYVKIKEKSKDFSIEKKFSLYIDHSFFGNFIFGKTFWKNILFLFF